MRNNCTWVRTACCMAHIICSTAVTKFIIHALLAAIDTRSNFCDSLKKLGAASHEHEHVLHVIYAYMYIHVHKNDMTCQLSRVHTATQLTTYDGQG